MKKYIITLSIVLSALTVSAQEVIWKLTYDVAFPFSYTKEYADQMSWRGAALDFDRFVGESFAIGMGFSWSTFVQKYPDSYYQTESVLLHGTQVRYVNNIPITARFSWYQALNALELYGTLGVGTVFPVGRSYLTAKLRYVAGFKTDNAPELSYLSVGLGVAW